MQSPFDLFYAGMVIIYLVELKIIFTPLKTGFEGTL